MTSEMKNLRYVREDWQARAEAAETERDKLQMRIADYRTTAYTTTNPANIRPDASDNELMNRFCQALDEIADDYREDGSEDWIEKFFTERDALRTRCARLREALLIARAELSELANVMSREDCYPMIDAVLSDTAQQDQSDG